MGVTHMQTATTLIELIQSELELAQQTETIIAEVMAKHGDDYDAWTEIMEQGNGYPDDNYANASIYAWLLHDHLENETVLWDFDTVANNTDMGTSGRDGWTGVLEHLVHIGYMTAKT